jgi:hypothetical protein
MFLDEGDVGGNIIRQWHKQPKSQVKDTEEALMLLDKWAQEHLSDAVDKYRTALLWRPPRRRQVLRSPLRLLPAPLERDGSGR